MKQDIESIIKDKIRKEFLKGAWKISLKDLVDDLSNEEIKELGILKRATQTSKRNAIEPLVKSIVSIKKYKSQLFLVPPWNDQELVLAIIIQNKELPLRKLSTLLPIKKSDLLGPVNQLLKTGQISCRFKSWESQPVFACIQSESQLDKKDESKEKQFFDALLRAGEGRKFARIYEVRELLSYSSEEFNQLVKELRNNYLIELSFGDPSQLTESQIKKSFRDEQGTLYLTLTWRGDDL